MCILSCRGCVVNPWLGMCVFVSSACVLYLHDHKIRFASFNETLGEKKWKEIPTHKDNERQLFHKSNAFIEYT